jgi:hypothetical protein
MAAIYKESMRQAKKLAQKARAQGDEATSRPRRLRLRKRTLPKHESATANAPLPTPTAVPGHAIQNESHPRERALNKLVNSHASLRER